MPENLNAKKPGEVGNMFDLVMAKVKALEDNVKLVAKDIEPILTPPRSPSQSEATVSKISAPLAVALAEVCERLNVLIEVTGDLHERNQL
jgi:hypothetical protein